MAIYSMDIYLTLQLVAVDWIFTISLADGHLVRSQRLTMMRVAGLDMRIIFVQPWVLVGNPWIWDPALARLFRPL